MALKAGGHPSWKKRTMIGDLDTPKGTAYTGANFAASFAGSDMGKIITNRSQIKAGDIILWRMTRNGGSNLNKGAVAHVGIAADDGMKNIYDHSSKNGLGFQYRPMWDNAYGRQWFAGVRLGGTGGDIPGDVDTSLESVDSATGFNASSSTNASTSSSTNASTSLSTPSASLQGSGDKRSKTTDKPSKPGDGPVEGEIKRLPTKEEELHGRSGKLIKMGRVRGGPKQDPMQNKQRKNIKKIIYLLS